MFINFKPNPLRPGSSHSTKSPESSLSKSKNSEGQENNASPGSFFHKVHEKHGSLRSPTMQSENPASIKGIIGVSQIDKRPSTAPAHISKTPPTEPTSLNSLILGRRPVVTPLRKRMQSVRNNLENFYIEKVINIYSMCPN
jgi:hypothetical protein